MKRISDEAFLKKMGWMKKRGYKVLIDEVPEGSEDIYYTDIPDFIQKCDFWEHKDYELVYDDVDILIETHYDEYMDEDGNVYDEPVQDKILENEDGGTN